MSKMIIIINEVQTLPHSLSHQALFPMPAISFQLAQITQREYEITAHPAWSYSVYLLKSRAFNTVCRNN